MKVWCVFLNYNDGCTYSSDVLHRIYANSNDAETEVTRIELLYLKKQEADYREYADIYRNMSRDEQDIVDSKDVFLREWHVR